MVWKWKFVFFVCVCYWVCLVIWMCCMDWLVVVVVVGVVVCVGVVEVIMVGSDCMVWFVGDWCQVGFVGIDVVGGVQVIGVVWCWVCLVSVFVLVGWC